MIVEWNNYDENQKISKTEAQQQLQQVKDIRKEVDSDRYLTPASYLKAKDICEKNPTIFNSESKPFPDYDGNGTPWDSDDQNGYSDNDNDNNNTGSGRGSTGNGNPGSSNIGSGNIGSDNIGSGNTGNGTFTGPNTSQSNFFDYVLIVFFTFFGAVTDYIEYISMF